MDQVRRIIERFCPVMGCNMPVEIVYGEGTRTERCLGHGQCVQDRGGCTNAMQIPRALTEP